MYRVLHVIAPPYLASSFTPSHVSPTCHTDIGSLNRSTFHSFVVLRSEVVSFLLLELKCGTVYLAMSVTSPSSLGLPIFKNRLKHVVTTSADFDWNIAGPCNSLKCLGHFKIDNDNDDDDNDDDDGQRAKFEPVLTVSQRLFRGRWLRFLVCFLFFTLFNCKVCERYFATKALVCFWYHWYEKVCNCAN